MGEVESSSGVTYLMLRVAVQQLHPEALQLREQPLLVVAPRVGDLILWPAVPPLLVAAPLLLRPRQVPRSSLSRRRLLQVVATALALWQPGALHLVRPLPQVVVEVPPHQLEGSRYLLQCS